MSLWRALLCALIALHGISGLPTLVKKGIETEKPEDAILYGYVIDNSSPNYLNKGDQIFKKNEYIAITKQPEMTMSFEYSDSEHTAAEKVAASLKISGHYGAFSAAASMEFSKSSSRKTKTVRVDAVTKAVRYEVRARGYFNSQPENYLTDYFKDAVRDMTPEELEKDVGIFYATQLDLGGETRMSYTMKSYKEDNEMSVKASLQASYGNKLMGASVEASGGYDKLDSKSGREVKINWSAQGGNTAIWLGKAPKQDGDVSALQQKWAASFTDDNLYPANFELKPVWELVKAVDAKKGAAYETYLKDKWGRLAESFKPTEFEKYSPSYCKIPNTYLAGSSTEVKSSGISEAVCVATCRGRKGTYGLDYKPPTGPCVCKDSISGSGYSSSWVSYKMSCLKDTNVKKKDNASCRKPNTYIAGRTSVISRGGSEAACVSACRASEGAVGLDYGKGECNCKYTIDAIGYSSNYLTYQFSCFNEGL